MEIIQTKMGSKLGQKIGFQAVSSHYQFVNPDLECKEMKMIYWNMKNWWPSGTTKPSDPQTWQYGDMAMDAPNFTKTTLAKQFCPSDDKLLKLCRKQQVPHWIGHQSQHVWPRIDL